MFPSSSVRFADGALRRPLHFQRPSYDNPYVRVCSHQLLALNSPCSVLQDRVCHFWRIQLPNLSRDKRKSNFWLWMRRSMTASHFVFDYDCTQVTEPCWPDLDIDIIFGFQYSITTWSQPNDTTPMPLKSLYMESIGHCNLPWLSHHWWFYTFVLISLLISLDNFYCEIMCSRTNASSDSRLPENAKALPCLDVIDAVRGHVGMAVDLQPRQVKQRNHLKCLQKKQQREFQSGEGANVSRSHDSQLWLRKSGLCAEMFG